MSFGIPECEAKTTKEKRVIEIPKYLYGFTCETRQTEADSIPSNVLLEKRSGGDYFKFDFKSKKPIIVEQKQKNTN